MELRSFPNPIYTLAIPQVKHARNRLLETMTHLRDLAEPDRTPTASATLSEALSVTETVLATLF